MKVDEDGGCGGNMMEIVVLDVVSGRERKRNKMGGFAVLGRERREKARNKRGDGACEKHEVGEDYVYFQFLFPLFS